MITGVGLGLRWAFLEALLAHPDPGLSFVEICPENFVRRGGAAAAGLARARERFAVVTHGVSLSVGGTDAIDDDHVAQVAALVRRVGAGWHSDHLSWSGTPRAALHELLPMPFTREAVAHVAARHRALQARLGVPLVLENVSYYAPLGEPEMSEGAFVRAVLEATGAGLLLDVNNVHVNASNHGYEPIEFLRELPLERVVQLHVAGHDARDDGLIVDTHGATTPAPVHELLAWVVERTGPVPVVLERDVDVPPLDVLLREVRALAATYEAALARRERRCDEAPGAGGAASSR